MKSIVKQSWKRKLEIGFSLTFFINTIAMHSACQNFHHWLDTNTGNTLPGQISPFVESEVSALINDSMGPSQ